MGSSVLGVGGACGGEERSESVVVMVAVSAGGASAEFDDAVDCFRGAVAGPVCVEVGQQRVFPLSQGPAQTGDLGEGGIKGWWR